MAKRFETMFSGLGVSYSATDISNYLAKRLPHSAPWRLCARINRRLELTKLIYLYNHVKLKIATIRLWLFLVYVSMNGTLVFL